MSEHVIASLRSNRRDRAVSYSLFFLSALLTIILPHTASVLTVPAPAFYSFQIVFALSSFSCVLGAMTDVWLFEYIGLLPMLGSFFIYGLAIILNGISTLNWSIVPAGICLLGFAWLFKARRIDLGLIYRFQTGGG